MGRPVLEIRDLWVGPPPTACRGVSLAVNATEAVAVLGGPGAGKSQLLRCIGLELTPSSGSVLLNGLEVTRTTGDHRQQLRTRAIELVHPPTTVEEQAPAVAETSTRMLRGERRATGPVAGMRQRIQIARALTQEASVLLVDEPFAGIDPPVRGRIQELLHRARTEGGTAVVVATRQAEVARQLADRVVVLHEGEVIESGPTDGVLDAPCEARTRALVVTRRSA